MFLQLLFGTRKTVAAGEQAGSRAVGPCLAHGSASELAAVEPPPIAALRAPMPLPRPAADGLATRHRLLAEAQVVPEAGRCVQCGICSHNCPMGIDVRAHAWRGRPIHDSHCLTCSQCVDHCPRGVLRFERVTTFNDK
jgi:ferredoxin